MSTDRLMAQLDEAKLVRYDPGWPCVYAWFGGHGVHAYDADGTEFDFWNVGSFARNDADIGDVERSMLARITNDHAELCGCDDPEHLAAWEKGEA